MMGKQWKQCQTLFFGAPKSLQMVIAAMKLKDTYSLESSLVAQRLKCLPGMRETWVRSLGREDPWRRKWQPTPVLLPGKCHGLRNLVGYSPWTCKESDTTE